MSLLRGTGQGEPHRRQRWSRQRGAVAGSLSSGAGASPARAILLLAATAAILSAGRAGADSGDGAPACSALAARTELIGRPWPEARERIPLPKGRNLRVLRPGEMGTTDFVPERLTVELDSEGRIRRMTCG